MNNQRKTKLWNYLTLISLILLVLIMVFAVFIYQYPLSNLNPFPPPTKPVALILPTSTITPTQPTPTFTNTPQPIAEEVMATSEPVATETVTHVPTSSFPTKTATPDSYYSYEVQGEPVSIQASVFNSERNSCDWMGLAGQVHDLQGRPVTGFLIQVGGTLDGRPVILNTLTGTALNYGQAGFEIKLSDIPADSNGTLYVRLLDQSNIPISAKIFFDTFADCEKNLTMINFKQIR